MTHQLPVPEGIGPPPVDLRVVIQEVAPAPQPVLPFHQVQLGAVRAGDQQGISFIQQRPDQFQAHAEQIVVMIRDHGDAGFSVCVHLLHVHLYSFPKMVKTVRRIVANSLGNR